MLNNFFIWYNTDPKAKIKIAFWIIVVVIFGLVGYIIFSLSGTTNNSGNSQTSVSSDANKVVKNTFETKEGIDLVNNSRVATNQIAFKDDASGIAFFDRDLKFKINKETAENVPPVAVNSLSFYQDNVIINSLKKSFVYYPKSKQFLTLAGDISQISTFNNDILFVKENDKTLQIKRAVSIDEINNAIEYTNIKPSISFKNYEIKVFNGLPYLLVYENLNKLGGVEIWSTSQSNSSKLHTIAKVSAYKLGQDGYIYSSQTSQADGQIADTQLIQFKPNGETIKLALNFRTNLQTENIGGDVLANRCEFASSKLYCLVKDGKASSNDSSQKDSLVVFDSQSNSLKVVGRSLVYTGNSVFYRDGKVFFVGQENGFLYKFNSNIF